ncbi:hypothetical protein [Deinococcus ruber]|uniref:Uncharacterized protein n=1 Tax=Deinococcus ruber TaxID=1848197 RepID=A0A918BZW8_9DEIO|nr:hypothetical protein [Deinococcus ruber]GGQ99816.1 hypothetical protein GCM10008957_10580 [Deinococcus ruber]
MPDNLPMWLDLYVHTDPHPRRFDGPDTLMVYLRRVERLSDDAISELMTSGEVRPPAARREYRIERL